MQSENISLVGSSGKREIVSFPKTLTFTIANRLLKSFFELKTMQIFRPK
jgi:hypothetical protein